MAFKSLTARVTLAFTAFDLFLNPFIIAAYAQMLGIGAAPNYLLTMTAMVIAKVAICAGYLRKQFHEYEVLMTVRENERTAELVLRADEKLQACVTRFGLFYATTWFFTYATGFLLLQTQLGRGLMFNSGAAITAALMSIGVWFGGFASGAPLVAMLTSTAAGQCSLRATQLGIPLPRAQETLQARIVGIALALALGPMACAFALGYAKQTDALEAQNRLQSEALVARLAEHFDPRMTQTEQRALLTETQRAAEGAEVAFLDRHGQSLRPDADTESDPLSYAGQVLDHAKRQQHGVIRNSGQPERIAYRSLQGGLLAVARADTRSATGGYLFSVFLFVLAISMWAPVTAIILGRAITTPIDRLSIATQKIVEEGNQSEMAALPVVRNDEVGRLSARFNDLLDMMRDLSRAADSIANGELRIAISRKGELPDAFRRMLESLRSMVREIRGTSVDLASAATEILAASQEQESAAASQSSAMEEINRTMDSLATSAAHVSDSVQGVVANAEQTLTTTDRMVARITELSGHANRIGEILDVIREIADRSDLLALNGSLEASRAGESGHGFALVATEMRRLAERVTASVEDVKRLVSDIRDSGSSTVAATEESRRLADATTEAARQITFVTQQQRSGTEQVSESIRNITDVVTQAVSATAQTRTSAQGLKTQADRLAALVKRFELEPGGAT